MTVEYIQAIVAAHYHLTVDELKWGQRPSKMAKPLLLAIYLCRTLLNRRPLELAGDFGDRNYRAIVSACHTVARQMKENPALAHEVRELTNQIQLFTTPRRSYLAINESRKVDCLELNPRFTFELFSPTTENRLAQLAAEYVATCPNSRHNPLFLFGKSGAGKTHLLQAIGTSADAEVVVWYCHRGGDLFRFTADHLDTYLRDAQVVLPFLTRSILLVDDIDELARHEALWQTTRVQLSSLLSAGIQVALASSLPESSFPFPKRWAQEHESLLCVSF